MKIPLKTINYVEPYSLLNTRHFECEASGELFQNLHPTGLFIPIILIHQLFFLQTKNH